MRTCSSRSAQGGVRRSLLIALFTAVLALVPATDRNASPVAAESIVQFTDAERAMILSHGPWPTPWQSDPSNRASGNALAVDLGEQLFFDRRLSVDGTVACATCHEFDQRWIDRKPKAVGRGRLDRNTPQLNNVRLHRWFGWDGSNDSLWSQSIQPILDARELGASPTHVAQLMRTDRNYACRYERVFGSPPGADDDAVLADVGKLLAAFQETLISGRTAFDDFRDALARGDNAVQMRYPQAAQRGLQLFVGRGGCSTCHTGPAFTNGEFHAIGVSFFAAPGRVDPGRYDGVQKVRNNRFNLLGKFNDDRARSTATGTRHVTLEQRNFGEFKTPSLRNASLTSPYMHDGQFATLREVIRHYSEVKPERLHSDGEAVLKPLALSEVEMNDLQVFLETLTNYTDNWWPTADHSRKPCK